MGRAAATCGILLLLASQCHQVRVLYLDSKLRAELLEAFLKSINPSELLHVLAKAGKVPVDRVETAIHPGEDIGHRVEADAVRDHVVVETVEVLVDRLDILLVGDCTLNDGGEIVECDRSCDFACAFLVHLSSVRH